MLLWDAWKAYAHRAGGYQTQVMLTFVYVLVLGPGALIGRMFGSRLLDLERGSASTWLVRGKPDTTLDALKRQF